MKSKIVLLIFSFYSCLILLSSPVLAQTSEYRAVWLQDDNYLERKLDQLKSTHFNVVNFGVWGARNRSLSQVIDAVHTAGLDIHLWEANAYLCAGHWSNCHNFITEKNDISHWEAVLPNGMTRQQLVNPDDLNAKWLDFGVPEAQENAIQVMVDYALNTQADGIHYDYIRYERGNYSFSDPNVNGFSAQNPNLICADPAINRGDTFPAFGSIWANRITSPTTARVLARFQDNVPAILLNNYTNASDGKSGQVLTFNWEVYRISFKVTDEVLRRAIDYYPHDSLTVIRNPGYNDSTTGGFTATTNWLKFLGYSPTSTILSEANLNALPASTLLFIPGVYLYPDAQISALDAFLKRGGNIIYLDGPTTQFRDQYRPPYQENQQLFKNIIGVYSGNGGYLGLYGNDKGLVTIPADATTHPLLIGLIGSHNLTFADASLCIDKWRLYMQGTINTVVQEVATRVHSQKPNTKITAAVFPAETQGNLLVHQNWPPWITAGYIDLALPMLYTLDSTKYANLLNWVTSNQFQTQVMPGLGPYKITECSQNQIILDQIGQLRTQGLHGFSMFESNYLTESGRIPANCNILSQLSTLLNNDVDPYYPIPNPPPNEFDFDFDGDLDILDFFHLLANFSTHYSIFDVSALIESL